MIQAVKSKVVCEVRFQRQLKDKQRSNPLSLLHSPQSFYAHHYQPCHYHTSNHYQHSCECQLFLLSINHSSHHPWTLVSSTCHRQYCQHCHIQSCHPRYLQHQPHFTLKLSIKNIHIKSHPKSEINLSNSSKSI